MYANYSFNAPLYTILFRRYNNKKRFRVDQVSYNEIAYLGNSFPISTTVLSKFSKGETRN